MDLNTDSSGINAFGGQISDAVASKNSSAAQAQLESAKAQVTAAATAAVTAAQVQVAAVKSQAAATVAATVESNVSGKLLAKQPKTKPSIESLKTLQKLDSPDRTRSRHRLEHVRLLEGDSRITGQRIDEARRLDAERNALPTHEAGDQWWIDPIVGLRGQINLTRWLFLAAQGDVGGFGVGSQITWNTLATVGVNFTRNIFAELGYRYMYVDHNKNNFLYQMNSFGLFSSIGVKF